MLRTIGSGVITVAKIFHRLRKFVNFSFSPANNFQPGSLFFCDAKNGRSKHPCRLGKTRVTKPSSELGVPQIDFRARNSEFIFINNFQNNFIKFYQIVFQFMKILSIKKLHKNFILVHFLGACCCSRNKFYLPPGMKYWMRRAQYFI